MNVLHVVALSGGKDSTAMALRLRELCCGVDFTFVCTPTGDELDEMFAHWNRLGELLEKKILPIMHPLGLNGLIKHYGALPNWRQRWCTRELKIEVFRNWLMQQVGKFDKIFTYVGLRYDEAEREGGDWDLPLFVEQRFPMREWKWDIQQVVSYLKQKGVTVPDRTDCARCFFQRLDEWHSLWKNHPKVYADAARQETEIGHTFRSPGRDTWPASLTELAKEFELGRVPIAPRKIDPLKEMQCRVCRA